MCFLCVVCVLLKSVERVPKAMAASPLYLGEGLTIRWAFLPWAWPKANAMNSHQSSQSVHDNELWSTICACETSVTALQVWLPRGDLIDVTT